MCHASAGKQGLQMNIHCGCECDCPVMLPIAEEIRSLEDHKKILQDQLEAIEKKISALKSVKEA
jgi:L-lactate utilization protein LutB